MMTQFGIMNKLSSGNMLIDVALCLLLPAIMSHLTQYVDKLKTMIMEFLLPKNTGQGYLRRIEYATAEGYYWYDEDNSRNKVRL